MRNMILATAAILIAGTVGSSAQQKPRMDASKASTAKVNTAKMDADIAAAFPTAPADWKPRLDQDETMKQCSLHHNLPPKAVAASLNLYTFNTLYSYGYANVYELGPLLDIAKSRLIFEGTLVAKR